MAIKKIEIRPKGLDGTYSDVLYPKTSIDMVDGLSTNLSTINSSLSTASSNITSINNSINSIESDVSSLQSGKANTSHTHDDRYYTEAEVNTKLNAKENTLSADRKRSVKYGTSDPTGGSSGDIYLQY